MKSLYKNEYKSKLRSAQEAVGCVKSGDRIFIGFVSSIAYNLCDSLWNRRNELSNITIVMANSMDSMDIFENGADYGFSICTPFQGPGERRAYNNRLPVAYTSLHLSQIDHWFKNVGKPNVAFLEVSEPDEDGYMSYGASGCCVNHHVKEMNPTIIAQVNKKAPYIRGKNCLIHVSEVDYIVEVSNALSTVPDEEVDDVTFKISRNIIEEVPDGATIQLGIGKLSTAIGYGLQNKNDLGIHTEMFSEPMMHLIKNGNVTNMRKGFMDGKSVFSFALGSEALYEFMDNRDDLYAAPFSYVNDPRIIGKNNRMVSINTAMAIDIFGQVAADSIGWRQYSAIGGQVDFVRGAQYSKEGKSFIATPSSYVRNGVRYSKIMLNFPIGTAVTTSRADVHYVATEYGCINLKTLTMQERIKSIIGLAHPDFRESLKADVEKYLNISL